MPDARLLGRIPSPPDARDWPLGAFLSDDPLDAALAALLKSGSAAKTTKAFASVLVPRIHAIEAALPLAPPAPAPTPTPTPTPTPPPSAAVLWAKNDETLDQGQTPHCVGFGGAQWGNTLPIDDAFKDNDGDALYYECKVIDGEPKAEDGSAVRSLAKALKARGRLSSYAFAASLAEARAWVLGHGPVVIGSDWTDDMFSPAADGFVHPTGAVAGGHCYVLCGYNPLTKIDTYLNSWGPTWGNGGYFKMTSVEADKLWANQGEAMAAVELPLAAASG